MMIFFFNLRILLTIKLINNYTIYKSMQYSTYITYNPNWHFYTEKKEKEGLLTMHLVKNWLNIKLRIKIIQKIV